MSPTCDGYVTTPYVTVPKSTQGPKTPKKKQIGYQHPFLFVEDKNWVPSVQTPRFVSAADPRGAGFREPAVLVQLPARVRRQDTHRPGRQLPCLRRYVTESHQVGGVRHVGIKGTRSQFMIENLNCGAEQLGVGKLLSSFSNVMVHYT